MQNYLHDVDEIDVLYARMHRDPAPLGLLERVYAAVAERARRRRRIGYWVLAISVLLAASLAFFLGQQARSSGALVLVDLLLANRDLLLEAPVDWVASLAELVPLPVVVPLVASVALIGVGAQLALTPMRRMASRGMGR
jgi:hypothetical protein